MKLQLLVTHKINYTIKLVITAKNLPILAFGMNNRCLSTWPVPIQMQCYTSSSTFSEGLQGLGQRASPHLM